MTKNGIIEEQNAAIRASERFKSSYLDKLVIKDHIIGCGVSRDENGLYLALFLTDKEEGVSRPSVGLMDSLRKRIPDLYKSYRVGRIEYIPPMQVN